MNASSPLPADYVNHFEVQVEGSVNYGDSVLVLGRVQSLPIRLRLSGHDGMLLKEGDNVRVGWRAQDSCLLVH